VTFPDHKSAKRVFAFDVAGIHVNAVAGRRGCPAEKVFPSIQSQRQRRTIPLLFSRASSRNLALKEITLESTDQPITNGIELKLTWLPAYYIGMLDGDR
jgi:hypothetical protein